MELENGAAIGWRANAAGQRFGLGHTNGGFYIFRTNSDPGATGAPSEYDLSISDTGSVGVGVFTPQAKLHVGGPNTRLRLASTNNDIWTVTEYITDASEWHTGVGGSAVFNDLKNKYYIFDAKKNKTRLSIDTDGLVAVGALQITSGADFSENFDVNVEAAGGEALKVEPGMVVSIDPANPGKLALATRAYDRRVAGIIRRGRRQAGDDHGPGRDAGRWQTLSGLERARLCLG